MQILAHLAGVAREFLGYGLAAIWFFALSWLVKRERVLADARAVAHETRITLIFSLLDSLAIAPMVGLITGALITGLGRAGAILPTAGFWHAIGTAGGILAASLAIDFAGYWRHRVQHSALLWPAHAVHHADTKLTWFSLNRMHPVDRLGTLTDIVIVAALGAPAGIVAAAVLIRQAYGHMIHADLPWSFGKLGWVLNPPIAHRWHHARDVDGSGSNFATLFSMWDRAFGTWYAPGPCDAPLGVREDMGRGALGQYLHPFKAWGGALSRRFAVGRPVLEP